MNFISQVSVFGVIVVGSVCGATAAYANTGTPVDPGQQQYQQQNSESTSSASALGGAGGNATSGAQGGNASALGGAAGSAAQSLYNMPRSYSLIGATAHAPALPGGSCPQGDSLAWSIGWGLFSWSSSTTRTEMACLDKMLEALRAQPVPPAPVQYLSAAPVAPVVQPLVILQQTPAVPVTTQAAPAVVKPIARKPACGSKPVVRKPAAKVCA